MKIETQIFWARFYGDDVTCRKLVDEAFRNALEPKLQAKAAAIELELTRETYDSLH